MKNILIIVGIVVVLLLGGVYWSNSLKSAKVESAKPMLAVVSDDYVVGSPTAKATLVEYLDFECEACRAYFPLVKQLEKDYPNDLRVVRRYFPLPGHRNGMTAALAVEAAARQGKYEEMHDLVFTEQDKWGEKGAPRPEVFEAYAAQLGLDINKFKTDVASQSVRDRVQRDVDSGKALGNSGTPTFFLNGEKIQNPQGLEPFKALIQQVVSTSASAQ